MSPRSKMLKARQVVKIVETLGFVCIRQSGSHMFFKHENGKCVTIPNHGGEDIGRGLLRQIVREIDIPLDTFIEML